MNVTILTLRRLFLFFLRVDQSEAHAPRLRYSGTFSLFLDWGAVVVYLSEVRTRLGHARGYQRGKANTARGLHRRRHGIAPVVAASMRVYSVPGNPCITTAAAEPQNRTRARPPPPSHRSHPPTYAERERLIQRQHVTFVVWYFVLCLFFPFPLPSYTTHSLPPPKSHRHPCTPNPSLPAPILRPSKASLRPPPMGNDVLLHVSSHLPVRPVPPPPPTSDPRK
ncbi:hypothetical protein BS50DRAFT_220613 [Corynespora cassiicola Philippines]|uniref:Uncharacterized protein n=1 Tax=Corynespora cassiicola Philippines TaxID=1448308 RepID=A0A2T2N333_CORCC|nr:hypothetical protein BS50DRAFT_220613 [Corynespora cassiicola Philippines]